MSDVQDSETLRMPGFVVPGGNRTDPHQADFFQCVTLNVSSVGDADRHAVGFEAVVESVLDAPLHHMHLFVCTSVPAQGIGKMFDCGESVVAECSQLLYAWTIGAGPTCLPQDAGFRVSSSIFLLRTHYYRENKFYYEKVDHSGVTIHFANYLRPYDAGIWQIGPRSSSIQILPKLADFRVSDGCSSECLAQLSGSGVRVFSYTLYAHGLGRRIRISHHNSSGGQLWDIANDVYWSNHHIETVSISQKKNHACRFAFDRVCVFFFVNRHTHTRRIFGE
eukprot:TRINITY_DN14574_c0_g1_i1.p1 TRINITY_DN14574_c0_g1~~TRINITY_DN14574_c0_g1_i1.p1  ORF type:complete len:292 (+),score=37.24 TRINITY_DN14574_c0_g1_i1:43-876(+)